MMSSQVNSTPDSAPYQWEQSRNDLVHGSQDGQVSPPPGNQKGFELDSAEQKNIRLDRVQTVLNRLVFFVVYWGVLQIAFIFFVGILYMMNIVLQWKKIVLME